MIRLGIRHPVRALTAALLAAVLLSCLQCGALAAKARAVDHGVSGAALMFNVYQNTEQVYEILSILEEKQVKATFFVGGVWAERNPEALLAIEQAGHEIGNHGYNHKLPTQAGNQAAMAELQRTEAVLTGVLGHGSALYAPPAGDYDQGTVDGAFQAGLTTVLWSADTIDWRDQDPELLLSRAEKKMDATGFLLMHPTAATVQALPRILDMLAEKGYALKTVSAALRP